MTQFKISRMHYCLNWRVDHRGRDRAVVINAFPLAPWFLVHHVLPLGLFKPLPLHSALHHVTQRLLCRCCLG